MQGLDKQVIVITGAATGIGRMAAEMLARAGHVVYAGLRDVAAENRPDAEALEAMRERESVLIRPIELNVLHASSCRSAADLVLAEQGRVDVVVNNAAILVTGFTEAFRTEQFLEVYDTNAVSWVRVNQAFLPTMRRQRRGLLLYTSSSTARMVDPFIGPYAASKAAADVLAETMHYENSQYGIESTTIVPGAYPSGTALFRQAAQAADPAVTAQYGLIAHLPAELPERLKGMHAPGVRTDAAEVSEAIMAVVETPSGTRPRRVVVDPQRRNLEALNALHDELQRNSFRRLGIDHLIDTVKPEGGS
jgi:NAD(P)-dependent dehydrogenase (short-subunit alcohol dehydrogenase family)